MQPLMEMVCLVMSKSCLVVSTDCLVVSTDCLVVSTPLQWLCNRLWKRKKPVWATAYGNGSRLFGQPLYPTSASYPTQYATALGNRLWKWYVALFTACLHSI